MGIYRPFDPTIRDNKIISTKITIYETIKRKVWYKKDGERLREMEQSLPYQIIKSFLQDVTRKKILECMHILSVFLKVSQQCMWYVNI